jgi:hypothetical protein
MNLADNAKKLFNLQQEKQQQPNRISASSNHFPYPAFPQYLEENFGDLPTLFASVVMKKALADNREIPDINVETAQQYLIQRVPKSEEFGAKAMSVGNWTANMKLGGEKVTITSSTTSYTSIALSSSNNSNSSNSNNSTSYSYPALAYGNDSRDAIPKKLIGNLSSKNNNTNSNNSRDLIPPAMQNILETVQFDSAPVIKRAEEYFEESNAKEMNATYRLSSGFELSRTDLTTNEKWEYKAQQIEEVEMNLKKNFDSPIQFVTFQVLIPEKTTTTVKKRILLELVSYPSDFPEYNMKGKTHTFQIAADLNTIQAMAVTDNWLSINFSFRPMFSMCLQINGSSLISRMENQHEQTEELESPGQSVLLREQLLSHNVFRCG